MKIKAGELSSAYGTRPPAILISMWRGYNSPLHHPKGPYPGLFGNVNIVAFIYPARQKQAPEYQCRDQKNDNADEPHCVVRAASIPPERESG
jgi:hypothetical protein